MTDIYTDFGLPPDIIAATLGGVGVQEIAGLESAVCSSDLQFG